MAAHCVADRADISAKKAIQHCEPLFEKLFSWMSPPFSKMAYLRVDVDDECLRLGCYGGAVLACKVDSRPSSARE